MEWNYRKWKPRTRVIGVFITFIIFFMLFIAKGHAEETVSGHIKEAVFDTLNGGVAMAAAAEAAATGNFMVGIALSAIASREFGKAYYEGQAAWDLYWDNGEAMKEPEPSYEPNQTDFFDRQE